MDRPWPGAAGSKPGEAFHATVGIGCLHSNNGVVSVTDEADRVVAEKRLPNDLPKILAFLSPWQVEIAGVVVESTYNWHWLVDGLQAARFTVHLANTTAIKKYDGLKHSGDETDARYLAQRHCQVATDGAIE